MKISKDDFHKVMCNLYDCSDIGDRQYPECEIFKDIVKGFCGARNAYREMLKGGGVEESEDK